MAIHEIARRLSIIATSFGQSLALNAGVVTTVVIP